jgi:hypothetical protein
MLLRVQGFAQLGAPPGNGNQWLPCAYSVSAGKWGGYLEAVIWLMWLIKSCRLKIRENLPMSSSLS